MGRASRLDLLFNFSKEEEITAMLTKRSTSSASRNAAGVRIGMTVTADDGWQGKVDNIRGECVVCIRNGMRPNDWLDGYRVFAQSRVTVSGDRATAVLKPGRHDAVVAELARLANARLARSWESVPD
jgi:hypothetical protein